MKQVITLSLIGFLAACSSLQIGYDYDKQTDFSKYKTYALTEETKKLPLQDLDRDRIIRAVETQMEKEGFTKSDNPDVLVDLHVKTAQRTEATATTTGPGMYGPWRYGYAGGFSTTQVSYNDYTEGTLFVNMIDRGTEKIVWQGTATKTLAENASPERREANINNAMEQIFTKYPPVK